MGRYLTTSALLAVLLGTSSAGAVNAAQPPPAREQPETADEGAATGAGHSVYRSVDAEGNIIFSDVATEGAEKVELGETIILPRDALDRPATGSNRRETAGATGAGAEYVYRTLEILEPADDAVIRDNAGNFTVRGAYSPGLHPDHRVQLLIDGAVYASGQGAEFELEHVDRGVHQLQLQIVDGVSSDVLFTSAPISMTLLRVSILHPGAKPKPPPPPTGAKK